MSEINPVEAAISLADRAKELNKNFKQRSADLDNMDGYSIPEIGSGMSSILSKSQEQTTQLNGIADKLGISSSET